MKDLDLIELLETHNLPVKWRLFPSFTLSEPGTDGWSIRKGLFRLEIFKVDFSKNTCHIVYVNYKQYRRVARFLKAKRALIT